MHLPGPSSTDNGLPVLKIGSPTVKPAKEKKCYLWGNFCELTGILVALNGGVVSFNSDDLTDQFVPSDLDKLVHFRSTKVFTDDNYVQKQNLR